MLRFTITWVTILKDCSIRKVEYCCSSRTLFTWEIYSPISLEHTSHHVQVHRFTLIESLFLTYVFSTVMTGGTLNHPLWRCHIRDDTIVDPCSSRIHLKGIVPIAWKGHFVSFKYSNPWWVQGHYRFLSGLKKVNLWR